MIDSTLDNRSPVRMSGGDIIFFIIIIIIIIIICFK
jgi:hypothetical protein